MESRLSQPNLTVLLIRVSRGEAAAREELFCLYRPYLRLAAGRRLPRIVQQRADASDIVQQTLIDAMRGLPDFRGQTEPELTTWMMRLLERNLLMIVRNNMLGKRDVRLEQDWANGCGSAVLMWHSLVGNGSSPASGVFRGEAALHLAMALEKLPADQSRTVQLRYIEQLSLQEIADKMDRSVGSVAGLIRRGIDALQKLLPAEFEELK